MTAAGRQSSAAAICQKQKVGPISLVPAVHRQLPASPRELRGLGLQNCCRPLRLQRKSNNCKYKSGLFLHASAVEGCAHLLQHGHPVGRAQHALAVRDLIQGQASTSKAIIEAGLSNFG